MRSAHAQDLFPGREPEVEGDNSRVVVAVGKRERAILFKKLAQKMEEASECSYPYKNCVPAAGVHVA